MLQITTDMQTLRIFAEMGAELQSTHTYIGTFTHIFTHISNGVCPSKPLSQLDSSRLPTVSINSNTIRTVSPSMDCNEHANEQLKRIKHSVMQQISCQLSRHRVICPTWKQRHQTLWNCNSSQKYHKNKKDQSSSIIKQYVCRISAVHNYIYYIGIQYIFIYISICKYMCPRKSMGSRKNELTYWPTRAAMTSITCRLPETGINEGRP